MCVIALDFDGVICDSAAETARSGWLAGHELWPDRFPLPVPEEIIDRFRSVRPMLKTGYESVPMLHMLSRGVPVKKMLNDGLSAVSHEIAILDKPIGELRDAFAAVRDRWIGEDFEGWLGANDFYSKPLAAAKECRLPLYVVTTKQTRFAAALCRHAGLNLPESHLFGLEYGDKSGVLAGIQAESPGTPLVFVEDRLKNLLDAKLPDDSWLHRFYADWGYGTKEDRALAVKAPHVTVVGVTDFARLLKNPARFLS